MSVEHKQKMEFVYKPDGAPEQRWPFAPARMSNKESVLIERLTGWTFLEWQDQFFAGSVTAAHALLWILLRRKNPELDPDAVEFMFEEYDLERVDELGRRVDSVGRRLDADGKIIPAADLAAVDAAPEPQLPTGAELDEAVEEGKGESGPTSDSDGFDADRPNPGP